MWQKLESPCSYGLLTLSPIQTETLRAHGIFASRDKAQLIAQSPLDDLPSRGMQYRRGMTTNAKDAAWRIIVCRADPVSDRACFKLRLYSPFQVGTPQQSIGPFAPQVRYHAQATHSPALAKRKAGASCRTRTQAFACTTTTCKNVQKCDMDEPRGLAQGKALDAPP